MVDQKHNRNLVFTLGSLLILMIAAPRLLPEIELPRASLLWYPVLHQLAIASVLGTLIWVATGRRRAVALAITFSVLIVLGPNVAGAIEYSVTGRNANVLAIANWLGITPMLNTFYPFLYDSLGYSITIAR